MAFTALLLFLNDWNLNQAAAFFARIATYQGYVGQILGNVMGLNPFHDYEEWSAVKVIQKTFLLGSSAVFSGRKN